MLKSPELLTPHPRNTPTYSIYVLIRTRLGKDGEHLAINLKALVHHKLLPSISHSIIAFRVFQFRRRSWTLDCLELSIFVVTFPWLHGST
jgi:hypothetical protein